MDLKEKIEEWYALKEECETAEQLFEDLKRSRERARKAVQAQMEEEGIPKLSLDDGTTIYTKSYCTCSVTEDNNEQLRQWLIETEGDHKPYVHEKVWKKPVTELVKKMVEEDHIPPEEFPDFLKVSAGFQIDVRGWKNRVKQ